MVTANVSSSWSTPLDPFAPRPHPRGALDARSKRSDPPRAPLSSGERQTVLRFAASFLWADLEVADAERRFLVDLARELGADESSREVSGLLARPPVPEEVDPAGVAPGLADVVRQAALRAIAADGRVLEKEMTLFEILDDLLPRAAVPAPASSARALARDESG